MRHRVPASIAWRAWTLDASWHAERMQALGVLWALRPILRRRADVPGALVRHAAPFNVNSWMAPTLLGAMARCEVEDRAGDAVGLRDRLAGPLSGAGDVHVWKAVRPACVALALLGVLVEQPVAGLTAALVLHGAALVDRYRRGFARGRDLGPALEAEFATVLPAARTGRFLRGLVALFAGTLAGAGLVRAWTLEPSTAFLMSGALVLGYHASKRQVSPGIAFAGFVALVALLRRFSSPVGLP